MSPLAYFITFHTHGTWLHGHAQGSVDPQHNRIGTPHIAPSPVLRARDAANLGHAPTLLGVPEREVVRGTIHSVCARREWPIHALNVRTTHVHIVVASPTPPERVMNDLKAWCTRRLREAGLVAPDARLWSRHGSTRWLNSDLSFARAIQYTLFEQGTDLP